MVLRVRTPPVNQCRGDTSFIRLAPEQVRHRIYDFEQKNEESREEYGRQHDEQMAKVEANRLAYQKGIQDARKPKPRNPRRFATIEGRRISRSSIYSVERHF